MMKISTWVFSAGLALGASMALSLAPAFAQPQPQQPQPGSSIVSIAELDVARYTGRWYEIAKFPNRFQKQCVSNTSADYTAMPGGELRVVNQCRVQSDATEQAVGVARQIGGARSAQLKVRFAPVWLSFLPFVWGDYWVVDLDARYELAAVSEPSGEYLWILSREPVVDAKRYADLLERLRAMGLDINKLEKSPQPKV